jgi:large subunit ribosomal protein L9
MKVILTKDVLGLGDAGEIVQVKNGYARNYLVPKAMAIAANKDNVAQVEAEKKRIQAQQAKLAGEMQALGKAISSLALKLTARAGDAGKLYGSVTNMDVAALLASLGHEIDRRRIIMDPIKKLGAHKIKVKLHPTVTLDLTVLVESAQGAGQGEEKAPPALEAS